MIKINRFLTPLFQDNSPRTRHNLTYLLQPFFAKIFTHKYKYQFIIDILNVTHINIDVMELSGAYKKEKKRYFQNKSNCKINLLYC